MVAAAAVWGEGGVAPWWWWAGARCTARAACGESAGGGSVRAVRLTMAAALWGEVLECSELPWWWAGARSAALAACKKVPVLGFHLKPLTAHAPG